MAEIKRNTQLTKFKKRQEEKAERRRGVFWRPRNPEDRVRLLPSQDEDKDFYYETGYHQLGEDFRNCVKFTGVRCPICDHVSQLYKGSASDVELAKSLKLKKQFLFNAVVRGEEFKKNENGEKTDEVDIKLMQVGIRIYEKIINAMLDEGIGDITDVDNGYDLIIKRKITGQYPDYSATYVARESTPLFPEDKHIEYTLTHLKDPTQYIKYQTADELQNDLTEYLKTGTITKKDTSSSNDETPKKEEEKNINNSEDIPADTKEEVKEEPKQETNQNTTPEQKEEPKPAPANEEVKSENNQQTSEEKTDFKKWEEEFDNEVN